jgi:hypothetical protein
LSKTTFIGWIAGLIALTAGTIAAALGLGPDSWFFRHFVGLPFAVWVILATPVLPALLALLGIKALLD